MIGIGNIYERDDDYEGGAEVILRRCRDKITSIIIEEGIEWIGADAFHGCISLNRIQLPNSLKQISIRAFWDCTSLTKITIPKNVVMLDSPFTSCFSLKKVTFKGNTLISGSTFSACPALISITVPYGTTIIDGQFNDCSNLKKLVLPKSVTEIYSYRLNWDSLEKLVITNKNCKLYGMDYDPLSKNFGSYTFFKDSKVTIIAPKDSEIITIAKKYGVKYKEVSLPKAPTISKVTTKDRIKTITWAKLPSVSKYQIYYAKTKNGTYTKLTETEAINFSTNKVGYIKIRAYKTYEGTRWYGSFKVMKLS